MSVNGQSFYGQTLSVMDNAGIGGCIDVAIDGQFLYAIHNNQPEKSRLPGDEGEGCLYILSREDPGHPSVIGKLSGLGNARQIELSGNLALVTAREDGLFIIDVTDPVNPRLLVHYDTIEFATGIACYGTMALVACRQYGVEIIDISNPLSPQHLAVVRVGEAQSVDACNGYLYAGVWGSHEVVICDIRNPLQPRVVSKIELDGRGDGVYVINGLCYVATGHHGRAMKQKSLEDPHFGRGNGLEIYDVHDPLSPRLLSRLKLRERFYYPTSDMWSVKVAGRYAYMSHTFNGVFVIDVDNPVHPEFIAHVSVPIHLGDSNYRDIMGKGSLTIATNITAVPFDHKELINSPIGGLAVAPDYLYLAGGYSDLHTVYAPKLAVPLHSETERQAFAEVATESSQSGVPTTLEHGNRPDMKVYRPNGQVYAVVQADKVVYAACGTAGIHVVELAESPVCLAVYPTNGFASDIKQAGGVLFVAEGRGGLSIWRTRGTDLELISRYTANGQSIKQVVLSDDGCFAILHVGSVWLHIVDVSDTANPQLALTENLAPGLIYGRQICVGLVEGRYAGCFWNSQRFCWFDLADAAPKLMPWKQHAISLREGFTATKYGALAIHAGKYIIFDPSYEGELADLPHYEIPGVKLSGKPTVEGDVLFVADRIGGHISTMDISDVRNPRLLMRFTIEGNPDLITCRNGRVIIPAGNQGMLIFSLEA